MSVTWSRLPLRAAMNRLSAAIDVPILIDRRVDPDEPVELTSANAPPRELLDRIASERSLGWRAIGACVYIGPKHAADNLRTLLALRKQDVQQLPARVRQRCLVEKPWAWDDLTTPRELIEQLDRESGIKIAGLEAIPHDLWSGIRLPAIAWVDRLTLLALQFDLTFEFDAAGATASLIPAPMTPAIERRYPGGGQPDELARRWKELLPEAQIEVDRGAVRVAARLEDHELISARPGGGTNPTARGRGKQVYSLTVKEQSVGRLLEALASQLNVKLQIDEAAIQKAGISLDQRVSIDVRQVSLEELLQAILEPAGLTGRRKGDTLEISVRP